MLFCADIFSYSALFLGVNLRSKMRNFKNLVKFALLLAGLNLLAFSPSELVKDARSQIGVTLYYDASYERLDYPMGDVDISKGVCTDVVVRALREQNIDLQELIHKDMSANFSSYPKNWGLKNTDKNIDHRRVPNIATYLKRKGYSVSDKIYKPGDIVTWMLDNGRPHIGIVSDKKSLFGNTPLIIHNIGLGVQEEDVLNDFKITGHFRITN